MKRRLAHAVLGAALLAACASPLSASGDSDVETEEQPSTEGKWGPNDVSVLWPLPETGPLPAGYLKLYPGTGEHGPYFPRAEAGRFPPLHADLPQSIIDSATVIVAMRIDPCTPSSPAGSCDHELRLSAETIEPSLADAAVHLVYRLDDAELERLLADLATWHSHSPVPTGTTLSVHPGLVKAGIDSPFARELHAIVERHATERALVRLTFNTFAFDNWSFVQWDKTETGWQPSSLPGLAEGERAQAWLRGAAVDELDDPSGQLDPSSSFASALAPLHRRDALAGGTSSPAVVAARDAVLRLEDPKVTHAENSDCGSCHLANQTRRWAEARGVSFGQTEPPELHAALRGNLGSTLAFGWHRVHNGRPEHYGHLYAEISMRVANETSETLAYLARKND